MTPIQSRLRRDEIWARWLELAAENGLHPGDRLDFDGTAFAAGVPSWTLYDPAEVERILDAMLAQARQRRPIVSWQVDGDEIRIRVEPGLARNWSDAAHEIDYVVSAIHRRQVVEDSLVSGLPVERTARRWGMGRSTLMAWRAGHSPEITPQAGPETAESCETIPA